MTTPICRAWRPNRSPARSPMKANPTRTKAKISPARFAPIRLQAASGGPAAADVAAVAAGVADPRTVWPDRSPTNSGRHRRRKRPARWPISTAIRPSRSRCRRFNPNPSHRRPSSRLPSKRPPNTFSRSRFARPPRRRPLGDGLSETDRSETETAQEAERAARRRSTVREKVSFLVNAQPEAAPPVSHSPPEPSAPAAAEPAAETATTRKTPRPARPAGGRAGSVAANNNHDFRNRKPPGKTGRFFVDRHSGARAARTRNLMA